MRKPSGRMLAKCVVQNSVTNQEKKNPVLNPHPNVNNLQTIDYFLHAIDESGIFRFLPLTPRDSLEEGSASLDHKHLCMPSF